MSVKLSESEIRFHLDRFCGEAIQSAEYFSDAIPDFYDVNAGRWFVNGGWTEGFWPGLLWLLYQYSSDEQLADFARHWTRLVAKENAEVDDHDLGFLFHSSCLLEYVTTGNEEMLPAAESAAKRLAARFLPTGQYIPAHGPIDGPDAGFAIIDTLMNLPLLLWASEHTGIDSYREIAVRTARTIVREHLRPDGSSCQVVLFDPVSGNLFKRDAVMAVSIESCWARGQAWGIHGLAQLYKQTGIVYFKNYADQMIDYLMSRLPNDNVVYHDLDDPQIPNVPKDTSAQAIAVDGLLTLAEAVSDECGEAYFIAAEKLLSPLLKGFVRQKEQGLCPRGFLTHGCKSLTKGEGVVSELIFGDYYFVHSLINWLRISRKY